MLSFLSSVQIYLVAGATDLRLSFNGLAAIVQTKLLKDPLGGQIFLFTNRRRNRLKILYFDGTGLWVCAKRLERGTFWWPEGGEQAIELRAEELALILGGLDLTHATRRSWYEHPRRARA